MPIEHDKLPVAGCRLPVAGCRLPFSLHAVAASVLLCASASAFASAEDDELAESPDLGPTFEFQEKSPGVCPGLSRVHCFCYPAVLSHGAVSGDIPAISEGAQRLAQGLASLLFQEGIDAHFAAMERYTEPELLGEEWQPSDSSHFIAIR